MNVLQGKPIPLGATVEQDVVNFAIQVEKGKKCSLLFFERNNNQLVNRYELEEHPLFSQVRFIAFEKNDVINLDYLYEIDGVKILDPYVKQVSYTEVGAEVLLAKEIDLHTIRYTTSPMDKDELKDGIKGNIVSIDWTSEETYKKIRENEVIAYRVHVRGFTQHTSSKVRAKGTFGGLLQKIPYFKELGVNQLQLLPCHEFEDKGMYQNYWGYAKGSYFAPKASYCKDDCAVEEFKEFVMELHKNEIEVVLDIPFLGGESYSYQRDCLEYYIMQYHVDGFVLNPHSSNVEELRKDSIVGGAKLMIQSDEFLHTMRRFLKGDEGMVNEVIRCIGKKDHYNYIANHNGFTLMDAVSYDGKHNELNGERNQDGTDYNDSWNCGAEGVTRKKAVLTLRKQQVRNAFALLLLSQGTPCILAGDEFGNTQKGNNNAYCQDNEISWLNWRQLEKEKELFTYVKELIHIRNTYPVLRQEHALVGMDCLSCGMPDVSYHGENAWQTPNEMASRQLGVYYCGTYVDGESCYIAYNMHWIDHTFALPALEKGKRWYQVLDTTVGVLWDAEVASNQRSIEVPQRSIAMYVSK